ncbi:MAG TPA: NfeD family protein, partial [Thermaerobacter sp.]
FGGRVDAATDIRGAIDRAVAAGVRVVGWVPDRALSAGALIAIATQDLYMAPGATLGAAEPRPADEKTVSFVRAEFEVVARSRGRDPRVAAAMVDKNVEIPNLVEKGEILTLTADRARDIGFIEGLAADRQAVLQAAGLAGASVSELAPTPAERVARFVTDPVVAPLLLSLGMAGLIAEFYVPGFGFPGIVGILSLILFFGGHLLAGVAGWEVALLFLAGLLLLGVELLAPGFGVFGVAGLVAVGAAIVLVTGDWRTGLQSLLIGLLVTAVVIAVLARYAGRRGLWRRLALPARLAGEEGFRATGTRPELVGRAGRALTPLRPAGAAEISGERVDVVTEGEFIAPGDPVVVVRVEGLRVVVRRAPADSSPAGP